MSHDLLTVLAIIGGALVLFVSDRVRVDAVALLVVLAWPRLGCSPRS